jgi:hypothetical protein
VSQSVPDGVGPVHCEGKGGLVASVQAGLSAEHRCFGLEEGMGP